jgi:hypothetical protein
VNNSLKNTAARSGASRAAIKIEHANHSPSAPINLILPRLERVRQVRPNAWTALCPAHDDKSPSLSVSETEENALLIRCWAGCGATAIVGAIGLRLRDLFPQRLGRNFDASKPKKRHSWRMSDVFEALVKESFILSLALERLLLGRELLPDDKIRALEAARRIAKIHSEVRRYE